MGDKHELLKNLKALQGTYPEFNPTNVPHMPHELFREWLQVAIAAGVQEPHSMTLSTIDSFGNPDARVLILKDIDEQGWYFASSSKNNKGQQLKLNSNVALTFYWPQIGRQIRIRGVSIRTGVEKSAQDFLARGKTARASALLGKQSEVLSDREVFEEALQNQVEQMEREPNIVDLHWSLYKVEAREVEFWQGNRERKHIRVLYRMEDNQWMKELLWP